MPEITKQEKLVIVNNLSKNELEVVSAASKVFSRVFSVPMIINRLISKFSERNTYLTIYRLEDKGIFIVDKESNNQLRVRFTEKGRSLCRLVKDKINAPTSDLFMQPSLF